MGVYNPFAELPNSCVLCDSRKRCPLPNLNKHGLSVYRHPDCPLVEVKAPHGRLIDADVLMKDIDKQENALYEHGHEFSFSFESGGDVCTAWYNVEMMVEDAPTIIPAEEGEP